MNAKALYYKRFRVAQKIILNILDYCLTIILSFFYLLL